MNRTVLLIGMWVDEHPEGGLPPRAAHLTELFAAHGCALVATHRTHCDPGKWLAAPPAGIVLSGSALNLGENCELADFPAVEALLAGLPATPVLGICFGHQYLAYRNGGRLGRLATRREHPDHPITISGHPLFAGLPQPAPMGENHGQVVLAVGRDQRVIATSADGIEALEHTDRPWLGVQFHPEYFPRQAVPYGQTVLNNWLQTVCDPGGARTAQPLPSS
jgi:GMP synthase-like glutamine amidotransferase